LWDSSKKEFFKSVTQDLTAQHKAIKLLRDTGESLRDLDLGNNFLAKIQAHAIKEKISSDSGASWHNPSYSEGRDEEHQGK
jgi:hypothetical protein